MRKLLIILLIFLATNTYGTTKDEIIHSGEFYYGEGISQNQQHAKDYALKELSSQIAVFVAGSFEQKIEEGKDLKQSVESIIQTPPEITG